MTSRVGKFGIYDKAWLKRALSFTAHTAMLTTAPYPDSLAAITADIAQEFCADLVTGPPYDFVSAFL
jgi:hypothetical protein